jgi:EAL domain-containing protein (putative c-di-GMP-specific phosphodiesterase class I)
MENRTKAGGLGLAVDMTRALDAGEFQVHYQPIVRLTDCRPTAVEALVRWAHPRRGMLAPLEFVPFAEATGLITELGGWVLRQACSDMVALASDLDLCVNISDTQLLGPGLVKAVLDALVTTGFPADRLIIEVCERTVVPDLVPLARSLTALRSLGVRIAMDDFGVGFSSLERLSRLPLDVVKVDACLVRNVAARHLDRSIVQAVVGLAQALDLAVVSEGIETVAQAEALQDLGCVLGQGYLFAEPGPAGSLADWINEGAPAPASTR